MIANLKRINRIVDGIRVALGDSSAICFKDIRPELGRKRYQIGKIDLFQSTWRKRYYLRGFAS